MRIETYDVLPSGIAEQVAALEAQAWPGSSPGHDPALTPRAVLLLDADGRVAACLALLHKPVRLADGRSYRAAGLSGVVSKTVLGAFPTGAADDEGRADRVRAAFTGIRVPLYPGTIDRLW